MLKLISKRLRSSGRAAVMQGYIEPQRMQVRGDGVAYPFGAARYYSNPRHEQQGLTDRSPQQHRAEKQEAKRGIDQQTGNRCLDPNAVDCQGP